MSNSSEESILVKFFLLTIQNIRLHEKLSQKQGPHAQININSQNYVLQRISQIESKFGMEIRHKQQKIAQLNNYVRQLHALNEQIAIKLQASHQKYQDLQEKYLKQIRESKRKTDQINNLRQHKFRLNNEQQGRREKQSLEDQHYHIKLLQRQKQQLSSQIQRLTRITVKQLQADIQTLNRQNQSYINSINNYRSEETNYLSDKAKYQQQILILTKQVSQFRAQREQNRNLLEILRTESESQRSKYLELQKKFQKDIQKLNKSNSDSFIDLSKAFQQKQAEIVKIKQALVNCTQQLDKKSKKLREYDEHYKGYVNKMAGLSQQVSDLKQQNKKLKQNFSYVLGQQRQSFTESKNKLQQQNKQSVENLMSEFNAKIKQIEKQYTVQKIKQIKSLEDQIQTLRDQLEGGVRQQEDKYARLQREKEDAVKQWEDIMVEMDKKKEIIHSLQRQVQAYRKNNLQSIMSVNSNGSHSPNSRYSNIQCVSQNRNYQAHKDNRSEISNKKLPSKQVKKSQGHANLVISREIKSSYHVHCSEFNENQRPQKQIKNSNYFQQVMSSLHNSTVQQQSRETLQRQLNFEQNFSFAPNINKQQKKIDKESSSCCTQCQTKRKSTEKSYTGRSSELSKRLVQQNVHKGNSQKYRIGQQTSKLLENPKYHRNEIESYQSHQLQRPSLSYKRRDEVLKKYDYIRTKTQQSLKQIQENQTKDKLFFQNNNVILGKTACNSSKSPRSFSQAHYQSIQNARTFSSSPRQDNGIFRSSSLNKVDYDRNIEQIQQYLSFDIRNLKQEKMVKRSASDLKLKERDSLQSERLKTCGIPEQKSQKCILMQKINKISSWRGQETNRTRSYNFYKKPSNQMPNRINKVAQKKSQKQNINEIIHKKCQYMAQR